MPDKLPAPQPGRTAAASATPNAVSACGFDARTFAEQLAHAERHGATTHARLLRWWWAWAAEGDDNAGNAMFAELAEILRGNLRRPIADAHTLEMVVQQTLITVMEKRHLYRAEGALIAWAQRIAANHWRELSRTAARRREVPLEAAPEAIANAESSSEIDARAILARVKNVLTADEFEMAQRLADGQTYDVIAAALGIAPGTVASRIHRMREKVARSFVNF